MLGHGLFADGSCWSEIIPRLQAAGLNVTSVQNPLTTLDEAVAATQRVLARQEGPTVLAGHSFAGMIVTEAGVDLKVSALVYVAARAPDADEDYAALAMQYPTPPATAGMMPSARAARWKPRYSATASVWMSDAREMRDPSKFGVPHERSFIDAECRRRRIEVHHFFEAKRCSGRPA